MFNGNQSGLLLYSAPRPLTEIPKDSVEGAVPSVPSDLFRSKVGFTVSFWFRADAVQPAADPQSKILALPSTPSPAEHDSASGTLPHVLYSFEGRREVADGSGSVPYLMVDAYLDSSLFLHLFVLTSESKNSGQVRRRRSL